MTHIEGTSQPGIGQNNYTIVADKYFVPRTTFFWRISSSLHQGDFVERQKRVAGFTFTRQHVGMNFTIEAKYKNEADKWVKLSKNVRVTASAASPSDSNKPKEATPDTGNKSAVINTPDDRPRDDGEEKRVKLKIHVYFDGTFGNKENIRSMEEIVEKYAGKKPDIHKPDEVEKDYNSDKIEKALWSDESKELENLRNIKKELDEKKERLAKEEKELSLEDKYRIVEAAYRVEVAKRKKEIINDLDYEEEKAADANIRLSDKIKRKANEELDSITAPDPTSNINSYTQVYTNIPIIYDMEDIEKDGSEVANEKILKIYVEGVGTEDKKVDDIIALATGSDIRGMGIPSKVQRAFDEIIKEADKQKIRNNIITSVEVCAIGFSRGAATTRNFVAERNTMLKTLKQINNTITDSMITYKFVGVFDTVCSVTDFTQLPKVRPDTVSHSKLDTYITSLQKNNIEDYKLAMRDSVEEVVHLVAADEHRLFFPLTTINTSLDAGCGYELVLPGSHCDLGGGDSDIQYEEFSEVKKIGDLTPSIAKYLIKNEWYPDTAPTTLRYKGIPVAKAYKLKRSITVGYNRIPLAMMLHFATELGNIKLKGKDEADRTKVHSELVPLLNCFVGYVKANRKHGRDYGLLKKFKKDYNHLRREYLHLSAVLDFGNDLIEGYVEDKIGDNIVQIKDVARLNVIGRPNRATFSDRGTMEELEVLWDMTKEIGKEIWDTAKEKGAKKIKDTAVDTGKDAAKELAKKAAKKFFGGF